MSETATRQRILTTTWILQEGDEQIDRLRAAGYEVIVRPSQAPHTEAEMIDLVKGVDAVVAGSDAFGEPVLAAGTSLKIVSRAGVGFDSVDVRAATARRIAVTITPGTNHESVADHAFGLILALARHIPAQDGYVRAQQWRRLVGADVYGQTLGILGLGRIGKGVARRGRGFDMRVVAYDPVWDDAFAAQHQVQRLPVDAIFREADFLTLHLPGGAETRHIVNAERLAVMKPTAFVVNTARGSLVDEVALYEALTTDKIAGAGLDVFDREPPWGSKLTDLPNVVLTPHVAGLSVRANAAMAKMAIENAVLVLRGERPQACVNPEVFG